MTRNIWTSFSSTSKRIDACLLAIDIVQYLLKRLQPLHESFSISGRAFRIRIWSGRLSFCKSFWYQEFQPLEFARHLSIGYTGSKLSLKIIGPSLRDNFEISCCIFGTRSWITRDLDTNAFAPAWMTASLNLLVSFIEMAIIIGSAKLSAKNGFIEIERFFRITCKVLKNVVFAYCYAFCPAMFTIHSIPNLSVSIPKVSPQGAFSNGWCIVPPAESFSQ